MKSIHLKDKTISNSERGWQNALRDGTPLVAIDLVNWVLFFTPRDEQKAYKLCDEIVLTARTMGLRFDKAAMYFERHSN